MKISHNWLQQYVDVDIIDSEELAQTLTMLGLAVELILEVENDTVFDLDVTSNRPDCLNHIGVARELAANYRLHLRKPNFDPLPVETGFDRDFPVTVRIEAPNLCPRYAARLMTNFEIGESPQWLKDRLQALDQRPINNLVDITNYVLFATGHPLHAFDYDKLTDHTIVVREARSGETLQTLDGIDRRLDSDMLVICDSVYPVALAGIMGGAESEISPTTETLLLESAYFLPAAVRSTARHFGMNTEASYRFERGADPQMPVAALNYACRLITEICGGQCVSPVIDENPLPFEANRLHLRRNRIRQVCGVDVDLELAAEILEGLEFLPKKSDNGRILVEVPSFRSDVELEDDLVEEVARHYGYEKIPSTYPKSPEPGGYDEHHQIETKLVDQLTGSGFYEAINYVFTTPEREQRFLKSEGSMIRVANPLSEIGTHLRTSLVPGIVESVRYNLNHGSRDIRLFEIGKGYFPDPENDEIAEEKQFLCLAATGDYHDPFWTQEPEKIGFFHLKGMISGWFSHLGWDVDYSRVQDCPFLHPGVAAAIQSQQLTLGHIGELDPAISELFKFPEKIYLAHIGLDPILKKALPQPRFVSLPKFPSVQRDLSFLLDRSIEFGKINSAVQKLCLAELSDFRLIDLYQGPNLSQDKYSLTVRLTFSSPERTLTQEEVNDRCQEVFEALRREFAIELR